MDTIAEKIKYYREKEKLSKSELARKLHVSPAYITMLENGKKERPSINLLMNISQILKVNYLDLIENTEFDNLKGKETIVLDLEDIEKILAETKQENSQKDIIRTIGKISGMLQSEAYSRNDIKNVADHLFSLYKRRTSLDILKDLIISEGYDIKNVSNEILTEILKKVLDVLELEFYKLDK